MSTGDSPKWTSPDFGNNAQEPPRIYTDILSWISRHGRKLGFAVGAFSLGALGYFVGYPSDAIPAGSSSPSASPAHPSSPASAEPQPSASESPTANVTATTQPTDEGQPQSSSGYRDVNDLQGNVGYYAPDDNDQSTGVIWGRAITRRDTVNFIKIACKGNVVTAGLAVVNGDNEVVKRYKASKYPKIIPKPCSDGEVVTAVRDTPFEYYSVLLGRIITKGTIGR